MNAKCGARALIFAFASNKLEFESLALEKWMHEKM